VRNIKDDLWYEEVGITEDRTADLGLEEVGIAEITEQLTWGCKRLA
jgi:hypothetical protein